MGDAGFFRGTSSDQDGRFSDKEKKLLKQMKFEDALEKKINMEKIQLDIIKPWITMRINEILGMEDDVVIEYIIGQLEEKVVNPKIMQINITGFLNARRAREFMGELWMLLLEADASDDGIPQSLVDKKLKDMKREAARNGNGENKPAITALAQNDWADRYQTLSLGRFSGPTKEKEVRDDRMMIPEDREKKDRSRSPRRQQDKERDGTPPRRKAFDEREKRHKEEDSKRHDDEAKRREEDRLKRRAEEKEREREREKRREREEEHRREERKRREEKRRRSRSRSRSPARRRFTEGGGSAKKRHGGDSSESEEEVRHKKKKKHAHHSSEDEDSDRRERKEKKSKKHKKEKKKKERKRSPTPSTASDTE